jgi:hypothetical protein
VLQDADIAKVLLTHTFEQSANAWFMDLAAQKIVLWPNSSDVRCGVAHAKPNFQDQRRGAAKNVEGIQRRLLKRKNKLRPQFCQSLGLTRGGATSAGDKTFDGFGMGDVRGWGGHDG